MSIEAKMSWDKAKEYSTKYGFTFQKEFVEFPFPDGKLGQNILHIENLAVKYLDESGWEKIRDSAIGEGMPVLLESDFKWVVKPQSTMYDPSLNIAEIEEIGIEAFYLRDNNNNPWTSNVIYESTTLEFQGFIDNQTGLMKSSYPTKKIN